MNTNSIARIAIILFHIAICIILCQGQRPGNGKIPVSPIQDDESEERWFKKNHTLKDSFSWKLKNVSSFHNVTFDRRGNEYDMENLDPYDIRAPDFIGMIDDSELDGNKTVGMWAKVRGETLVFLVKNENGRDVDFVHVLDRGVMSSLVPVHTPAGASQSDYFITITSDDYDPDGLMFNYGHRYKDKEANEDDKDRSLSSMDKSDGYPNVLVFSSCGSNVVNIIDMAIVFDSSFCSVYGFSGSVERVESIVALASLKYSQLNIKLRISYLEGHCDSLTDPYKDMQLTNSGCNSYGLIDEFSSYWNIQMGHVRRDVVHLFSGTDTLDSVNCVYSDSVCQKDNAYGVHHMTFSNDLNLQAVLLAHGLGYSVGADLYYGDGGNGYIMSPVITAAPMGFSQRSVNSVNAFMNQKSCVRRQTLLYISNASNGRRLYTKFDGGGVYRLSADNGPAVLPNQVWFLQRTKYNGARAYFIINNTNGQRIYTRRIDENSKDDDGVGVTGGAYNWEDNQKWVFSKTSLNGMDTWFIQNALSGRHLYAENYCKVDFCAMVLSVFSLYEPWHQFLVKYLSSSEGPKLPSDFEQFKI